MKATNQRSKIILKSSCYNLLIFSIGAIGYYTVEILYRGRSHWTMAICGGICLITIGYINKAMKNISLLLRALLCAVAITAVEFICGCIVNLWLNMCVWDYSSSPLNLLGQICPLYSFYWFILSILICGVISLFQKKERSSHV